MSEAKKALNLTVTEFQMIPDAEQTRYDLLLEVPTSVSTEKMAALVERFDQELGKVNIEYAQKRFSKRLAPVRLHLMKQGWSERQCRADVHKGKRDSQYKWPYIQLAWNALSRQEVVTDKNNETKVRGVG
jgi:hypothetical protein